MSARFRLASGHAAFDGHFPGQPIVPAVVLLAEVMARVEADTGRGAAHWTLASAKFLAPVGPDVEVALVHEAGAQGTRRFELRAGDTRVANGVLAPRTP